MTKALFPLVMVALLALSAYTLSGAVWNGIFVLAGFAAALFVHWLTWLTRLRYLSASVGLGMVVFVILSTFSLMLMFPEPGSGADGAYVMQSISIGVWAFLFPFLLMFGAFQARSLPASWWKGALSIFFEIGLAFLLLGSFNYFMRRYNSMPDTGLPEGQFENQFILSFVIGSLILAVSRPIVRLNTRRPPPTVEI